MRIELNLVLVILLSEIGFIMVINETTHPRFGQSNRYKSRL